MKFLITFFTFLLLSAPTFAQAPVHFLFGVQFAQFDNQTEMNDRLTAINAGLLKEEIPMFSFAIVFPHEDWIFKFDAKSNLFVGSDKKGTVLHTYYAPSNFNFSVGYAIINDRNRLFYPEIGFGFSQEYFLIKTNGLGELDITDINTANNVAIPFETSGFHLKAAASYTLFFGEGSFRFPVSIEGGAIIQPFDPFYSVLSGGSEFDEVKISNVPRAFEQMVFAGISIGFGFDWRDWENDDDKRWD